MDPGSNDHHSLPSSSYKTTSNPTKDPKESWEQYYSRCCQVVLSRLASTVLPDYVYIQADSLFLAGGGDTGALALIREQIEAYDEDEQEEEYEDLMHNEEDLALYEDERIGKSERMLATMDDSSISDPFVEFLKKRYDAGMCAECDKERDLPHKMLCANCRHLGPLR